MKIRQLLESREITKSCLTLQTMLIDYPFLDLDPIVKFKNDNIVHISINHDLVKCFLIVRHDEFKLVSIDKIYEHFVSPSGTFFNQLKWFCSTISYGSTKYSYNGSNFQIKIFSPFKDYETQEYFENDIASQLTFYFNDDKINCDMTSKFGDVISVSGKTYSDVWIKIKEKITEYED